MDAVRTAMAAGDVGSGAHLSRLPDPGPSLDPFSPAMPPTP